MPKLICLCNEVSSQDLKKLIHREPMICLEELTQITGASTSCGRCRTELKREYLKMKEQSLDPKKHQQGILPFFPSDLDLNEKA